MNSKAQRFDRILRAVCAAATSVGAALFLLMFVGLCVEAVRHHEFNSHELGLPIALGLLGLLTFFCTHIAWKLWRGSLSANGVTFMPTWFIQMFGVFFLGGLLFVAYHNPSYPLLAESISVALAMIFFGKHVARRKRGLNHGA